MCTSIISNRNKIIVGWNLDILDMEYRVRPNELGVFIEIKDNKEGWMPLFGANKFGGFVGMPTCWPFDDRSNQVENEMNIINLDIDYLLGKRSFEATKEIVENNNICSVTGLTFMGSLSNKNGDVLHIVPGQGYKYYKKPKYKVLTNFSPFKMDAEKHPWMGLDRYNTAEKMLSEAMDNFDVEDCFEILKSVSQQVCPTVLSMVYDVTCKTVYWCEKQEWDNIKKVNF